MERRRAKAEREALERNAEAIRHRCTSFAGFVKEAWEVLEPETTLVWNWHLDALCSHLEAISRGEMKPRLIVNIPPGSSKSMIVTVMWQAWEWSQGWQGRRFLTTSFELENVTRDTRKTRDLILSDWFKTLWPEVRLKRAGETSFSNHKTGTREGVAFSSLMGKRGDRLIIDDPHSLDGAESDTERTKGVKRFLEGGTNRLNDQVRSAIVVVMQRIHEFDLSGALLKKGGYTHLCLPMEFEEERTDPKTGVTEGGPCRTYRPDGSLFFVDPRITDGEVLDPIRFPPEAIDELKDENEYAWAGQYQQRPTSRQGGLFKRDWLQPLGAMPAGNIRRCRAWDFASTAKKAKNNPDWTVGLLLAETGGRFIVEHVIRFRGPPGEVHAAVKQTAQMDGPNVVIRIPQDPSQAGVDQRDTYIKELAGYTVEAVRPSVDKELRARPAAIQAKGGNLYYFDDGEQEWVKAFLNELTNFPASRFDDQVDALADAVNELALGSTYDASMDWV